MKFLNETSLDVWNEYLKEENRKKISHRILELSTKEKLTEKEEKEFQTLLQVEFKLLKESESLIEINLKAVKKFNYYENILKKNDKLYTIFCERINNGLTGETYTEDDVSKVYFQLMNEEVDVIGHQRLNQYYEKLKKDGRALVNNEKVKCEDPNCVYCSEIKEKEYSKALGDLETNGYLNPDISEEDKLMELMVLINRLENDLSEFKTPGCQVINENKVSES